MADLTVVEQMLNVGIVSESTIRDQAKLEKKEQKRLKKEMRRREHLARRESGEKFERP